MIGTYNPAHARPIYAHLEEQADRDSLTPVRAAGSAVLERLAQHPNDRALAAVLERVTPLDAELAREAMWAALGAETSVYDAGVLVGFALAKTWPDTPEGLPDWPRRAIAYAGLEAGGAAETSAEVAE